MFDFIPIPEFENYYMNSRGVVCNSKGRVLKYDSLGRICLKRSSKDVKLYAWDLMEKAGFINGQDENQVQDSAFMEEVESLRFELTNYKSSEELLQKEITQVNTHIKKLEADIEKYRKRFGVLHALPNVFNCIKLNAIISQEACETNRNKIANIDFDERKAAMHPACADCVDWKKWS